MKKILQDADVKRSLAYLGISFAVAGVKAVVEHFQSRRGK